MDKHHMTGLGLMVGGAGVMGVIVFYLHYRAAGTFEIPRSSEGTEDSEGTENISRWGSLLDVGVPRGHGDPNRQ